MVFLEQFQALSKSTCVLLVTKSLKLNELDRIRDSYKIHQTIAFLQLFAVTVCLNFNIADDKCWPSRNSIINCRDSMLLQQFTTETKNSNHYHLSIEIQKKQGNDIFTEANNIPNVPNHVNQSRTAHVQRHEQTIH